MMDKRILVGGLLVLGLILMVYSAESGELVDQITHPDQYKTVKCDVDIARNWLDAPYIKTSACSVVGSGCNNAQFLSLFEWGEYDGTLVYQSAYVYSEKGIRIGVAKTEQYSIEGCEKLGQREITLTLKDETNVLDNTVKQVMVA